MKKTMALYLAKNNLRLIICSPDLLILEK